MGKRRIPKDLPREKAPRSFRLTPQARTIDYGWLHALTEENSYEFCKKIRFRENKGEPYCPGCGSTRAYVMATRKGYWSCGDCRKQYSITNGTIFHSRKLPFLKLVKTVYAFADCAKGTSACELGLKQDLDYKTIWVLLMKIREAMASRRNNKWLLGTVEMDAAYFGGKIRKANEAEERKKVDHRKAEFQQGKRTVMVARERGGGSVLFATKDESAEIAHAAVQALVKLEPGTVLVTDQSPAYRDLEALATHNTVDHSKGFKINGISTNMAESSFSRMRRAEIGVYHHMSATWLDFYAGEICWREDLRKVGNAGQALDILEHALAHPQSRNLKGYWQHHELPKDQRKRSEVRWERVHKRVAPVKAGDGKR
jgi:transposase-like protein